MLPIRGPQKKVPRTEFTLNSGKAFMNFQVCNLANLAGFILGNGRPESFTPLFDSGEIRWRLQNLGILAWKRIGFVSVAIKTIGQDEERGCPQSDKDPESLGMSHFLGCVSAHQPPDGDRKEDRQHAELEADRTEGAAGALVHDAPNLRVFGKDFQRKGTTDLALHCAPTEGSAHSLEGAR